MVELFERTRNRELLHIPGGKLDFFSQRLLVCLPGDQISSFHPNFEDNYEMQQMVSDYEIQQANFKKFANGMLKMAERLLGGTDALADNSRIVMAAYPYDIGHTGYLLKDRENYNFKDPDKYFSDHAKQFVEENLLCLVSRIKPRVVIDGSGSMTMTSYKVLNERLPQETLNKNLSRLTLFGFSHGASFAGEICNCLKANMRSMGYNEKEVKQSLANVNLLTLGGAVRPELSSSNYFTAIHFHAGNDHTSNKYLPQDTLQKSESNQLFLEKPSDNCLSVVGRNSNPFNYFTYATNDGKPFGYEDERVDMLKDAHRQGYKDKTLEDMEERFHNIRSYASYKTDVDNTVPVMVQNVLRNMYFRENSFSSPEDMLLRKEAPRPKLPQSFSGDTKKAVEADLLENRNINNSFVVRLIQSTYNKHIEDMVAEFKGASSVER